MQAKDIVCLSFTNSSLMGLVFWGTRSGSCRGGGLRFWQWGGCWAYRWGLYSTHCFITDGHFVSRWPRIVLFLFIKICNWLLISDSCPWNLSQGYRLQHIINCSSHQMDICSFRTDRSIHSRCVTFHSPWNLSQGIRLQHTINCGSHQMDICSSVAMT